jgi:hypothetical protein
VKKHLRYLWYVLRHKWFVGVECVHVGLYWRALTHDLSKFLPSEFLPYVDHFYGRRLGRQRDSTGYYKPTDTGDAAFDFAWLLHQHRNDHHWQWWAPAADAGECDALAVFEMSERARLEMLCDWCGASRAQGHGGWGGVVEWYDKNKGSMYLGLKTRRWVERTLCVVSEQRAA